MVMRMLEAGGASMLMDGARPPDPDNPAGFYEFEPVKRLAADADFLAQAGGHAVKVVAPLLFSLPNDYAYRVIFVERRLDEVMASQEAMLKRSSGRSPAATDRSSRAIATGEDRRLEEAFQGVLDRLRSWMASQPNVSGLCVTHASAIRDPRDTANLIATFLADMEWASPPASETERLGPSGLDSAAMAAAVDPGLYRQRG